MDVPNNEEPNQGSHFKLTTSRVPACGPGLSHGQIGQPAEFSTSSYDTEHGLWKKISNLLLYLSIII